jgi:hypothetical protein
MLSVDWKGYRIIAWACQALLAAAIVVMLVQRQWWPAGALTGFLVISYLFVAFEHRLPALFDLVFMIAALINASGWAWDLYNKPGPVDEIAHFFTIFAITLAAGYLLYNRLAVGFFDHRVLFLITIASLGIALGALWEVAEWLADFVIAKQIVSGLPDTITDIMLDSAGAIVAALLNLKGLNELAALKENAPAHGAARSQTSPKPQMLP